MQDLTIKVSDEFYKEYVGDFSVSKRGKINSPQALVHWVMRKEARTRQELKAAVSLLTPRQKQIYECRVYKMKEPEIWE